MNPVAFSLFGLDVRWYGLVYAIGFFITIFLGWKIQTKIAKNGGIKLSKQNFENLLFGLFISAIIGGRLGEFIFYNPTVIWTDPLEILKIWHGGMAIHGGFIGSFLYILWFIRKHKISFLQITDILVIPVAITLILGRFANFMNGELVGIPTGTEFGIIFPHIDDQLRYPTQLYESGKNLILSLILIAMYWKGFWKERGVLTITFLGGYGIMRFIIEFWKEGNQISFGLNTGQILCIGMIILAVVLGMKKRY